MIRPFDWRDVTLIQQLSEQGVCLDSIARLTRENQPLQNALLAYVMPGAGAPTLIWKKDGQAAFGQLRHRPGEQIARALFISPAWSPDNDGWYALIDRLAVEAGRRGGHNLIAEVDEASSEFEALRLAGFAIYARQTVWRLTGDMAVSAPSLAMRAATTADGIAVSVLYSNVVPRLVQQVEPAPKAGRGFVFEREGEVIAFLDVRRGPLGIWVEPYLHPEAYDLSEAMLYSALHDLGGANRAGRPVYVCVRRYQDWLQDILQLAHFETLGSQAGMVKRLVARVTGSLLRPLPAIEGQAPIVRARIEIYEN
ncbi:MAG: hypothetical protein ACT4QE_13565 [Anaerolineales bacterium]